MPKTPLQAALQKANRRIKALEKGLAAGTVIYTRDTRRMIDTLRDKAELLTNVSKGNLRIGGLQAEDRARYLNILTQFNESQIGTITGQRKLLEKTRQAFMENYGYELDEQRKTELTDLQYETLVRIFESDQFQKFKEKYGTYSNAINAMVTESKGYAMALGFLNKVVTDESGRYFEKGSETLDAKQFIEDWKQYGKRRKK